MKKFLFLFFLFCVQSILAQKNDYSDRVLGGQDNGIVGKIDDEFTVTPHGQACYTIPIPVVAGTGGMSPRLSVSYNSSSRNGMIGYGFDLIGLSVISRVPSDYCNDGYVSSIDYTEHDHFSLDGVRLKETANGNDSVVEYNRVTDNTSLIYSYGKNKLNPDSFVVKSKDGLVYEYKSLKLLANYKNTSRNLYWLVTKVTDTKGNYYRVCYTYVGSKNEDLYGRRTYHSGEGYVEDSVEYKFNEYYPERIEYTGNAESGLKPYASLRFEYVDRSMPISFIIGSQCVRQSRVLSKVNLYNGESLVKYFQLDYSVTADKKMQLSRISEYTGGGAFKYATRFTWSNISQYKFDKEEKENGWQIKANYVSGDFNGDGKTDALFTPVNSSTGWKGYRLCLSDGRNFVNKLGEGLVTGEFDAGDGELQSLCSGDFNGDGYDDVLTQTKKEGKYHLNVYLCKKEDSKFTFQKYSGFQYYEKEWFNYHVISADGDGLADLFIWHNDKDRYLVYYSFENGSNSARMLAHRIEKTIPGKWGKVDFLDYNGDGITDYLYRKGNSGYAGGRRGSNTYFIVDGRIDENGKVVGNTRRPLLKYMNENADLYCGDFNGDGKSDIFYRDVAGRKSVIYLSGTNGILLGRYGVLSDKYINTDKESEIYVGDYNGDGLDDFCAIEKDASGNANSTSKYFVFYINNGSSFDRYVGEQADNPKDYTYYSVDMNGDGKMDLYRLSKDRNAVDKSRAYGLYYAPSSYHSLLSGITDGMGYTTEITYKNMSDGSVCKRGNMFQYPLLSFGSVWPLVARVRTPDGLGGNNDVFYNYENAIMHRKGRGFLGFECFTVYDKTNETVDKTYFEINRKEYVVGVKCKEKYVLDRLVEKQICENTYVDGWHSYVPEKTTTYTYADHSDEILSTVESQTFYDRYGNVTKTVTDNGDVRTVLINDYEDDYEKWYLGRLVSSKVEKTNSDEKISRTSKFEYDAKSGMLVTEWIEPDDVKLGYRKKYTHDVYGNIIESEIVPNDKRYAPRKTKTDYDEKGRFVVREENALGYVTSHTIEPFSDREQSQTDANGHETVYEYDEYGRVVKTATPLESVYTFSGWCEGMPDAPKKALYFTYTESTGKPSEWAFCDNLGRTVRKVTESLNGRKVYADYVYDNSGNLVKRSEPYYESDRHFARYTEDDYDRRGRITRHKNLRGDYSFVKYEGLKVTSTDELGHKTVKVTDVNGNLAKVTDDAGTEIQYFYDVSGHCVEIAGPRTVVRMEYDKVGNRVYLDDPDCGVSKYEYNAYGELVASENSRGQITTCEYDVLGRVTKEFRPDVTVITEYDDDVHKGTVKCVYTSTGIKEEYSYDVYERVVNTRKTIRDKVASVAVSYNKTNNRIDVVSYPNGLSVKNNYDSNGYLTSVSDNVSGLVYWQKDKVNARGNIEKETYGNGLSTVMTYDSWTGNVRSIYTEGIQNLWYGYDEVCNLQSREDLNKKLKERFEYDNLNQLTKVYKNNELTQEMTYDNAGNILSKTGVGHDFTYRTGTNKLMSFVSDGYEPKLWDKITYTSFNKISSIKCGESNLNIFYGVDKQRAVAVQTDKNGTETRYYFSNLYELVDKNGRNTEKCYIFADGKAVAFVEKASDKSESSVFYFHRDHLGSVQSYTDSEGKLVQELSYDAWGRRRNPDTWEYYDNIADAEALDRYGFGGQEHLDLFELVDMNGRMYDPVLGRFLSPDPIVQAPDFTLSLNRYAYCVNNPLGLTDPSGYSWLSSNWKSLVASCVGIAVSVVTAGAATGLGVAIIAGAAGGAASALVGAILNGSNIGQIAKSTLTGAFWGAVSGFANNVAGAGGFLERLSKHIMCEGAMEGLQGGNILHGMMMGAVSCAGGTLIDSKARFLGKVGEISANAVLSGTISEIGGGKFANGAVTGAFSMMFNDMMHREAPAADNGGDDWKEQAMAVAAGCSVADGPLPYGDVIGAGIVVGVGAACVYDVAKDIASEFSSERVWVTYTLTNDAGQIYVGRTSGFGDPVQLVNKRYNSHHMKAFGFKNPKIDRYAVGSYRSNAYYAIRGREQQMMDYYGGVGSPRVGNRIRGVSKINPSGRRYWRMSNKFFGSKAPYTGY